MNCTAATDSGNDMVIAAFWFFTTVLTSVFDGFFLLGFRHHAL